MSRAWRIEYEGVLYHVLSRGNDKQNIVTNDDDRKLFLATVGEMVERFEIDLFVFVLMDYLERVGIKTLLRLIRTHVYDSFYRSG